MNAMIKLIQLLGAVLVAGCTPSVPEVYYRATDVKPPAAVRVEPGPCGNVVVLNADKVPAESERWLRADSVLEIDDKGRILRTWRVPADHYPLGVEGEDLIVAFGSDPMTVLRVTPEGRLLPSQPPLRSDSQSQRCPAPFEGDEMSCTRIPGQPHRYLAATMPCT